MWHLLSHPHAPDVGQARSGISSVEHVTAHVRVSEHDVKFSGAAATSTPPAPIHHHWPGATLVDAVRHIHITLPEPRPVYRRREAGYSEVAWMSRQMDHL
ncbi:hypothetical protein [Mycobacterium gastri]|nr:hypothetical protein [Mycobacterium gastri]